jgi:hypothetical protein
MRSQPLPGEGEASRRRAVALFKRLQGLEDEPDLSWLGAQQ